MYQLVLDTSSRLREESPPNSPASQNEQPTEYDEHIPWKPPRAMVFVNALWFLSLILNVAVAFIAMLSKEWLAKLLANHNGSHLTQAWHRQKVWDKIYQWRLPVFQLLIRDIDYAVVLFSIGLAIFLWDLGSAAVAVPVTIVVALMIIICILFTIFPFVDGYSPFSTSTSSILFAFRNVDPHAIPDDLGSRLDPLILRILQRIITSGDNLQAVNLMSKLLSSFIHTNDSQNLLERSRMWSVVRTRFHALRPYDLQFDASAGLYAQFLLALERFRCNTGYETTSFVERVCLFLWAVQGYNRRSHRKGYTNPTLRQESLQLGRVVVYHCLKALSFNLQYIGLGGANFETTEHFSLANHVTSLFERPEIFEYEDVYHDICVSFAMIMCCILSRWPALNTTPFIMRFIRAHRSNVRLIPAFGLVLGLFAFSRYDYPMDNRYGSSLLAQSQDHVAVRMERALNVLWYYLSDEQVYPEGLATLGLLYLQAHRARYHLDAADRQTISEVLELYPRSIGQAASIYTLPLGFDMYAAHVP
ncbi:hypothetical protein RHS04_06456 [Rhizoctonia solani]|uniref:DUF6535 domain-containing protein n=1 Tax=Rhizoctonia solani TaxID=456999 RepID=A0A8H7H473_9AGAM|nr:hypothetical protein RHS04_06456 [Rhizoctonia solani]